MAFDTTPQITGPDPYLLCMEEKVAADKASYEARMLAKYGQPVLTVKSGITVGHLQATVDRLAAEHAALVASHKHEESKVAEIVR